MLTALVLTAILAAPVAAEPIAQMPDGTICIEVKHMGQRLNYQVKGLPPGAPEAAKRAVLNSYNEMGKRQIETAHRLARTSFVTPERITMWGGGGGGISYKGRWTGQWCEICQANECNSTCWNTPGFPDCPPPC